MNHKKIESVFFDIDGTLVSFKTHAVPESTVRAIRELRSKGIKVFVATGRMLAMLGVLDKIEFDGYITYNGGCCVDARMQEIFSMPVPKEQLQALVERLKYDRFPVSFMCRDAMYVNERANIVLEVAEHVNVPPPEVRDPVEIIKEPVYQLCIYVDDAKMAQLHDQVLTGCTSSRWISWFADVNVKGMSKQVGIDRVLEHYGLDIHTTMAFGDGANDVAMLKHVAVGVAMGNASEEVKRAADYVTDTVDENGVYLALKQYGLLD